MNCTNGQILQAPEPAVWGLGFRSHNIYKEQKGSTPTKERGETICGSLALFQSWLAGSTLCSMLISCKDLIGGENAIAQKISGLKEKHQWML